ncbi:MAG: hypothetical protein WCG90_08190 [Chitinophagia bacterium]
MLETIILLILLNTTLIHCASKWGLLERYNTYRKKWMPLADCFLCIGFWLGVVEAFILVFSAPSFGLLLLPFCVASGTNWLVNQALLNDYIQ